MNKKLNIWKLFSIIIFAGSAAQRGLWAAMALQPSAGYGLLVSRGFLITHNDPPVGRTPLGQVISLSQSPLPDNTKHTQQTNIHTPEGIRTDDRSRRAAVDLRLRPRGHWDLL
jgi:hypothetical protein